MLNARNLVKRGLQALGFDIVRSGASSPLVLRDALRRLSPTLVLDVGAHTGLYRDYIRDEVGYSGCIISFEPSPREYAICCDRAVLDNNWKIHQLALGDFNGSLPLNVSTAADLSSFRQMDRGGETRFSKVPVREVIEVPVRRLDDVLTELKLDPTGALLKTDTQGFELEVLRGARDTVKIVEAIQLEVSQIHIYENTPDMLDVLAEVRSYGFDIAALAPVGFHGQAVVEFDCLLVRRTS